MTSDARFEDADEAPLALQAYDSEDLQVLSSLAQDAIFPATEMSFDSRLRRFALLVNRFRWERGSGDAERVQAVLSVSDVMGVQTQGITPGDTETVLSILSITFEPGDDGMGRIEITLSGDGAIGLEVEALDVSLKDVTRPYVAPSRQTPNHPD